MTHSDIEALVEGFIVGAAHGEADPRIRQVVTGLTAGLLHGEHAAA
ncbi:hypothetical protein [Burkholderia ubonensis]|nr:hypothetical protein [Burkholderia ubonensis]